MISCKKNYDYDFSVTDGVNRYTIDWQKAADSSTNFLINNYWNSSPGFFNDKNDGSSNFQYWPQAHALDVILDAFNRSGNQSYLSYVNQWYIGVRQKNGNKFTNDFFDDMGWNALAMLRAYDATSDMKFRNAVTDVWTTIKSGWSTSGGGGIQWSTGTPYFKNTPTNGPACILSARLYQDFKNPDDLQWATKIYKWLKDSVVNPISGEVIDGIQADKNQRVTNVYTYNQGLMIGAAIEMFKITKDQSYLNDAITVANYSLNSSSVTTSDRLLKDEGNGDGGLFKGVFVRYFTELILTPELSDGVRNRYLSFLKLNAETLWWVGANKPLGIYGSYWKTMPTGPSADLTTETSGCILIEAMALLKKKGFYN